jgi:molybdopterin molybdotransferase
MDWVNQEVRPLASEQVGIHEASGRVVAADIIAGVAVPPFDRAAMDGYAVQAEETYGASDYSPATFRYVGRSRPGCPSDLAVGAGEAVEVATGAPLPSGADSVVPVEATRREGMTVIVSEPIARGRHIGRRGEDIAPGTIVFEAGRVIRPQDLGILSALAATPIAVVRRPTVAIVITGDELLSPATPARAFQIADMNSVMLAALVARDGGTFRVVGPLPDCRETIKAALVAAARDADLVLVSGGSSAGPEDHVPEIIAELGRLLFHGLALRPAGPTGLGQIAENDCTIVMMPGNPVSCLCAYDFVAGPIVRRLGGQPGLWPYRAVALPLARKLTSAIGRLDYARVRIRGGRVEPVSSSGASILSSVSRADGFVIVPPELEGYAAGAIVTVWCYDEAATMHEPTEPVGSDDAGPGELNLTAARTKPPSGEIAHQEGELLTAPILPESKPRAARDGH